MYDGQCENRELTLYNCVTEKNNAIQAHPQLLQ